MPVCFIPPYTPLLYSKTGVYKGFIILLFLQLGGSNVYPQYLFEQKYENSQKITTENCHFTAVKNRCKVQVRVFVMTYHV